MSLAAILGALGLQLLTHAQPSGADRVVAAISGEELLPACTNRPDHLLKTDGGGSKIAVDR